MGELQSRWEGHILRFVNSIDNWKLWLVEIEDALLSNVYSRPVRRLRWRIKHVYLREDWTCDLLLQFARSTVTEDCGEDSRLSETTWSLKTLWRFSCVEVKTLYVQCCNCLLGIYNEAVITYYVRRLLRPHKLWLCCKSWGRWQRLRPAPLLFLLFLLLF